MTSTNAEVIERAYTNVVRILDLETNDSDLLQNHQTLVRLASLACLRQIVNPATRLIDLAVRVLRDPDDRVRLAAAYTLSQLTYAPISRFETNEWKTWWRENRPMYVLLDRAKILSLTPRNGREYHDHGCVNYDLGFYTNALSNFRKSCRLNSEVADYSRCRIWLTRAKMGESQAATQELTDYLAHRAGNPDDWPARIARFLTGQVDAANLFKAATGAGEETPEQQLCEAYFYVGAKRLNDKDREAAIENFKKCLGTQVPNFDEGYSALIALSELESPKIKADLFDPANDRLHVFLRPGGDLNIKWSGMSGFSGKGYYGAFYLGRDWKFFEQTKTNRMDLWESDDKTKIVVMVHNGGPIYMTENAGLTWDVYRAPGHYIFSVTGTEADGGFTAMGTIVPQPQAEQMDSSETNTANSDWYGVVVAPTGQKLIMNSLSGPVLSITQSPTAAVVSWPASASGFVLQENLDLTTTNWIDVTNKVEVVSGQCQVLISLPDMNNFFRLRSAR